MCLLKTNRLAKYCTTVTFKSVYVGTGKTKIAAQCHIFAVAITNGTKRLSSMRASLMLTWSGRQQNTLVQPVCQNQTCLSLPKESLTKSKISSKEDALSATLTSSTISFTLTANTIKTTFTKMTLRKILPTSVISCQLRSQRYKCQGGKDDFAILMEPPKSIDSLRSHKWMVDLPKEFDFIQKYQKMPKI
jgi:hypothetical protein